MLAQNKLKCDPHTFSNIEETYHFKCDGFPQVIPSFGMSMVHIIAGQTERHWLTLLAADRRAITAAQITCDPILCIQFWSQEVSQKITINLIQKITENIRRIVENYLWIGAQTSLRWIGNNELISNTIYK